MKYVLITSVVFISLTAMAQSPHSDDRKLGVGVEVAILPHTTTLSWGGHTNVDVRIIDAFGYDIPDAKNKIEFTIKGEPSSAFFPQYRDGTQGNATLVNGRFVIQLAAGKKSGSFKVEVTSNGLQNASAEIHVVGPYSHEMQVFRQFPMRKSPDKMIGADISFLPELEARGMKFSDKGVEGDALTILKNHGFNYVRLRIFNDPAAPKGYSPGKGFCDLEHTRAMILRAKKAGMKVLLDFHYSDYWADPQQQYKPSAWADVSYVGIAEEVKSYTKSVLTSLKGSGALPDMVQIGNEINHGMIWPDGRIDDIQNLVRLIQAGIEGTHEADPSVLVMLHVALGGQDEETAYFLDFMKNLVSFDIIGLSYYPRWHGSMKDLQHNIDNILLKYDQDVCLVEYTFLKRELNDLIFALPHDRGMGTCIWEPLNTWETLFDKEGRSNQLIEIFDKFKK